MKASTQLDYRKRIDKVLHHIEENLSQPLPPGELARVGAFSLHHFHRVFKGQTGESLMQCIRRLRLERAAFELRYRDSNIIETALSAGYQSHEAFLRAFRRQFGCNPSEFRAEPSVRHSSGLESVGLSVEIRRIEAIAVVTNRYLGPYLGVSEHWDNFMQSLFTWNAPMAFSDRGSPRTYAWVHDDPEITAEENLRYDACVELTSEDFSIPLDSPARVSTIKGGLYAVALHRGAYDTLAQTYLELIGCWFPKSNYALHPVPIVERYLKLPTDTKPEDLETEIWVQIAE